MKSLDSYNRIDTPARFSFHLPIVSLFVRNPVVTVFLLCVLAGSVSVISVHYTLSVLIFSLPVISFYFERNLLGRVLFPPYSIVVLRFALGSGLGVAFITFARDNVFDPYLLRVQLITLTMFPFGWIFYRLGFGKIPRMTFPDMKGAFGRDVIRPLIWVGWFFLIFDLCKILILVSSGNLDRGDYSLVVTHADGVRFGFWTYFQIFPRFNAISFFLFPLVFQRSIFLGKVLGLILILLYFTVAFLSGSRGIVFFPIIFIGLGLYFFRTVNSIKLDLLGIVFVILILPLIVFMDAFRNTDAYRATRTSDISGRIFAMDDALDRMSNREMETGQENAQFLTLGYALLEVSDSLIYELTPEVIPYAGFDGAEAILYTWVPYFIMRNRPILLDSNIVMWNYTNRVDRVGREVTLFSDSYRRFGWFGIPACVAIFFFLYGLICGKIYKLYLKRNAFFGILFVIFLFSYFQNNPFETVLETWWGFAYNLPKHAVALVFGGIILCKLLNVKVRGGAIQYGGRD